jgi:hypothetical protein
MADEDTLPKQGRLSKVGNLVNKARTTLQRQIQQLHQPKEVITPSMRRINREIGYSNKLHDRMQTKMRGRGGMNQDANRKEK